MKRLTNILSYLWLLLLMAVTACSDLEEEVGPMQGEEEVELTIQTEVSGMKGSTRTAPTESITAITAYAFDSNSQLIKEVKAILSDDKQATSGNLKIKVPKRTGDIHFIAKNNAESPDVTISIGENVSTLLSQTTDELHYWGKATYNGGNSLDVTLIRNMAKIVLDSKVDAGDYIAGFVNYNQTGTLLPGNFEVGTLNATNDVASHNTDSKLDIEHYLFEHANVEDSSPLYAICNIGGKYYKVAFAASDTYFPIIRNHEYTITVNNMDEMYAEDSYDDAVNSTYPINDLVIEGVSMTVTSSPTEVLNKSGQTFTVTVTIPEGITKLNEPTHDAFDITPPNSLTPQNGKYTVTQGDYEFTFTVKEDVEAGDKTLSFSGRGKYKSASGSTTITLYDKTNVALAVAVVDEDPSNPSLTYGPNSVEDLQVNVTIPAGVTTLTFSSDYFTLDSASDLPAEGDDYLSASDNSYTVNHQGLESLTLPFRLRLKDDVSGTASFTFAGSGKTIYDTEVTTNNITLTSRDPDSEYIYWEGYLPLSQADNTAKITVPKTKLIVGRVLRIECEKTADNQALALLNNWTQFTPDMQYSTEIVDVPLTDEFVNSINANLIITGRGASGMIMEKISILPAVEIEAAPTTTTLNYSANSVSDLIVNVTIPKEVSTLSFTSDYFDVGMVVDTLLTNPNNGTYTVVHPTNEYTSTSTSIRLRLKEGMKAETTTAGFTFSGTTTNENLAVIPADVNDITLTESGDGYVRWQGDVELNWNNEGAVKQIPLLYSWFYDANDQLIIPVGSTLHLEYELTSESDASIQFAECNETWNDDAYYFSELHVEYDNNGNTVTMGLNLDNNTGIYSDHTTSIDLILTQAVLENMVGNRTDLLGETDVVMAIQGGNVRLKSISVIPIEEVFSGEYSTSWNNYLTINGKFPKGTQITLYFTATTTTNKIEVHDLENKSFFPKGIDESRRVEAGDDCFYLYNSETSITFTIPSDMTGFMLNGDDADDVILTSIVAKYPDGSEEEEEEVIFEYNFDDGSMTGISSWFNDGSAGSLSVSDRSLVINVTESGENSWSAQASINVSFEQDVSYKLSFRVKAINVDITNLPIYFQEPTGNYPVRGTFLSDVSIIANEDFKPIEVTTTAQSTYNDGRLIIDLGHLEGTIYIDDLKLVRSD